MIKKHSKHPQSTRSNPHARFSKKQIQSIVLEIESGELSRTEACGRYGMSYSTVTDWMNRYSEVSAKTRKVQLSRQQQREVARAILDGRMTIKEAQVAHNIAYPDTVRRWVRMLREENSHLALPQQSPSEMPLSDTTNDKQKEAELAEARLKIAALETMIDLAEEQFKISIRKKSGAKQ